MSFLEELSENLPAKARNELSFWAPIAERGFRGFSAADYRTAAVHYKQYGLIQIGRDIGDLKDKIVLEVCCGPTPILSNCKAAKAIGVDPLCDVYASLWDLSNDGVQYIASEIETLEIGLQADTVICWNGIDHVRDIEAAMANINSILKKDGEFWTFTNIEDGSFSLHHCKNPDEGHQHQYSFNELSLDRFFTAHGWQWVTKSKYVPLVGNTYPYPGIGGVLTRTDNIKASLLKDLIRAAALRVISKCWIKRIFHSA